MSDLRHDEPCSSPGSKSVPVDTATLTEWLRCGLEFLKGRYSLTAQEWDEMWAALSSLETRLEEAAEETARYKFVLDWQAGIADGWHRRAVAAEQERDDALGIRDGEISAVQKVIEERALRVAVEAREKALREALTELIAEIRNNPAILARVNTTTFRMATEALRAALVGVRGGEKEWPADWERRAMNVRSESSWTDLGDGQSPSSGGAS